MGTPHYRADGSAIVTDFGEEIAKAIGDQTAKRIAAALNAHEEGREKAARNLARANMAAQRRAEARRERK